MKRFRTVAAGGVCLAARLLGCFLAAVSAWGDGERASAEDRLGFMDRVSAITRGRVQLEGGYAFVYDNVEGTDVTQHAVPDLLLRVGLTERLEVRVGWPGYVSTRFEEPFAADSSDETVDPNVGFMFDLCGQRGLMPQTAVLASVPITLTGNSFIQESLQPLSQLLYQWYLTDRLTLGGTTGVALFRRHGDDFVQWQQSANLVFLWTDRMSTFAEWEVLVDHGSIDDGSQHLFGGGIALLCTDRLQLSWRAGVGLNRRAPDFLTGARFALRF